MELFVIVNMQTKQVVTQRGQTAKMFSGVPGKMRIEIPDGKNTILHGAGPGSIVWSWKKVNGELIEDAPLFKIYTATVIDQGTGEIVVGYSDPVFNSFTNEVTAVRTLKTPPPPPTPEVQATAEIMSPAIQAILLAILERQGTKVAPAISLDKDSINARAIEIRAAQIVNK